MGPVLGIGGSDHDVHACIVVDGQVVSAIEEERLSRRKYGLGGNLLAGQAQRYCLDAAGLQLTDVERVVADEILAPTALLNVRSRAQLLDHHLAHAASAWFTADFDAGAVVVVDNAGGLVQEGGRTGLQATSWYRARGQRIELLGRVLSDRWHTGPQVAGRAYQRGNGDHSLGHFYMKITGALGFVYVPAGAANQGFYFPEDGITMGLASHGDDRFVEEMWSLATLEPGGAYSLRLNDGRLDAMLRAWLPPAADFEARASVAAAGQEVLTRLLCHVVDHALAASGDHQLCLAGGVAMNSVATGELLRRTAAKSVHVPPCPGDNGTGLGAALWTVAHHTGRRAAYSVYAGRSYGSRRVTNALDLLGGSAANHRVLALSPGELLNVVAVRLARGAVVGWFEGGAEHGRRALGHRSILADPRDPRMREHLNLRVKLRQPFRPFAPVVPVERATEFFEICQSSPYMQIVSRVRPHCRDRIPAVVHVDGTARLQTLGREQHPRLHALLGSFEAVAGIPILLNTSFNGIGEPIVETPEDAVLCYLKLGLDVLVLEDSLVVREDP